MQKVMLKKILPFLFAALMLTALSGCTDTPDPMSRAVLASADVLEFATQSAEAKIIRVTSDGDWTSEAPEWISLSPASGHAGQTEVTVTVNDNLRDGSPDVPRHADLLFKGRNLESIATVLVRQQGDKFRNPQTFTVEAMEKAADETVVRMENLTVLSLSASGAVATDGTRCIYIKNLSKSVAAGEKINVAGVKLTSDVKFPYITGERIESLGSSTANAPAYTDISLALDLFKGDPYTPVSLTGEYDGANIVVDGQTNKALLIDAHKALGLSSLAGHKVTVTGYYAGTATPVVKIIPAEVKDLGAITTVYFSDDFEWLAPWTAVGDGTNYPAADIVGCNQESTVQPQITKSFVDGVSAEKALLNRGYLLQRYDKNGPNAGECIYIQTNYLKLGKTGYQGELTLPLIPSLASGVTSPTLSFDWYPQRQGKYEDRANGVFDPTELVVIVTNGTTETQFPVAPHPFQTGDNARWIRAEIPLTGATITKDTRITIRNVDSQLKSAKALRWHIDNLLLTKSK